jgi:hypothetical protein
VVGDFLIVGPASLVEQPEDRITDGITVIGRALMINFSPWDPNRLGPTLTGRINLRLYAAAGGRTGVSEVTTLQAAIAQG